MAAHGIGIAIAVILAIVAYIGYKYITAREKAEAPDMEDIFARYNDPETGIVEDAVTDNGCAFDLEDNKWQIVRVTRERGASPSWTDYQQEMEKFKQL